MYEFEREFVVWALFYVSSKQSGSMQGIWEFEALVCIDAASLLDRLSDSWFGFGQLPP